MEKKQDKLILQFIPSLVSILKAAEDNKGKPLTETEVIDIRDSAICITVSLNAFQSVEESRGYNDIDPENCWNEWSEIRKEF